ncbi:hypothetical protein KUTeg_004635 [Tegillarca granosa]|uniref:Uncharacterized protein n=1 Tax=Tegillarca granosa TaxID=220873 RepID=A0ABQ9FNI4_TEGGR|nr:hypothetical protein KUTeg_004635 [Tegillarca granosa]
MPKDKSIRTVLPLKLLADRAVSMNRAKETDLNFFKDMIEDDRCPEYNGYNTRLSREQGHTVKPGTRAVYLPLIDMAPSNPDTIMTALCQAQMISRSCGQDFTIFTADLQLYRVAVNVTWAYPERFGDVVLRLGGMHTLMSFVGSVGTLMASSGLEKLLESTFGGVAKMLSGKKFPQNVRALRLVAELLLRPILSEHVFQSMSELESFLDDLCRWKICQPKLRKDF